MFKIIFFMLTGFVIAGHYPAHAIALAGNLDTFFMDVYAWLASL